MRSGERERGAHVRIRGGRITCLACRGRVAEVVLLESDRPLCLGCAGDQAGMGFETIYEWLRSRDVGRVVLGS